jgi:DNA repair exonuclease SbcCD ATPase subunit
MLKIKDLYHKINNKAINMTRSNTINKNKKIFILEGSGADYKDKTMCYEKFKVIVGDNKEELNFYYTFFANNSLIKKGEIYELSITGNFVQDSSEIIQGIDNGGYEFVKITPSLLIKELWDEKEKGIEKLDLMEEDLENKIEYVERINQELLDMRNDFSDLTVRFDNLQVENEKNVKRLNDYKESLRKKEEENKKINQSWASSKEEVTRLKGQLNSLRSENTKIENGRVTLKRQADLFREQEVLQNQLKTERRKNQMLIEQLEEVQNQELSETIQKKLQGKKD